MVFSQENRPVFLLPGKILQGYLFIAGVLVSLFVIIFLENSDTREIIMVTAVVLAFAVISSRKTWIPILICLLLIRDFSLCPLIGDGTLKIGDVFIAYLFSLWMLGDIFIKNSTRFVKSKLDLLIVLFILFYVCSLFWSTDIEYGLVRVLKLIRNFLFFIIMRELFIRDFWGSYKRTTASYIGAGVVLLIVYLSVVASAGGFSDFLSLYQKKTLTSLDLGALRVRGTGRGILMSGPSMWLMITGTFIFGSLMLSNSRAVRTIKTILIMIMFASATVLTLARSVFGMLIVLLILLFSGSLYLRSKRNIISISVILVIFAVMGAASGMGDIYSKRFKNAFKDGSWTQRVDFYRAATDAFVQNPMLGIGAGSNYSWQKNYPEIGENTSRIVHSAYMLVLSELGVTGFIIFLVIIYFWIRYLWDCLRSSKNEPSLRSICMTLFAFSVSYLLYILIVGEFEAFEPWLMMAIASAVKNLHTSSVKMVNSINLALRNEKGF